MKILSLVILFIYVISLSANSLRTKYVYQFGIDVGVVAFAQSGRIGFFEKTVTIPIVVPMCSKLSFVLVEVNDLISQPTVTFDEHMSSVTIKFKPWQFSKSSYLVTAKAIPDQFFCTGKLRHYYEPPMPLH